MFYRLIGYECRAALSLTCWKHVGGALRRLEIPGGDTPTLLRRLREVDKTPHCEGMFTLDAGVRGNSAAYEVEGKMRPCVFFRVKCLMTNVNELSETIGNRGK